VDRKIIPEAAKDTVKNEITAEQASVNKQPSPW